MSGGRVREARAGVTTVGTGSVQVAPDVVVARLGAQCTEQDAAAALATASAASSAMVAALVAAGVAREDVRTVETTSWTDPGSVTEAGPAGETTVRLARTTVNLSLEATLRDTATAGGVIGGALAAGEAPARLERTSFGVSDRAGAITQARALAFAEAAGAAAELAALAGRTLGPVLEVAEGADAGGGPERVAVMARAAAHDVPLEGGVQEVRVRLVVRHAWAADAG